MSNDLVYALNRQLVTSTGSLGIGNVSNEGKIRFVITNTGGSNVVRVRARIIDDPTWTTLVDFTGDVNEVVDVFTWDEIEVIVLVYDSSSTYISIIASSFDGSVISISTPSGDVDNSNTIVFTSSDNSITITGDQNTGTIDFVAVGGGGGGSNYSEAFNATTDWSGPTLGLYSITVPFVTHAKANPIVQSFEEDGADFELVNTEVSLDASHNVTILVTSSPDLRFAGKIIIS